MDRVLLPTISHKNFILEQLMINENLYKQIQSLICKQHNQNKFENFQEISNKE
jgi:hypothetical protein